MAFSDDFTGTNGQLLTARPGWFLGFGDDCFNINTNRLAKVASTTSLTVVFRTDDGSTDQRIKVDLLANAAGWFVFGSGTASTFGGYVIRPAGGPSVRLYRWSAGAQESTILINSGTIADLNGIELRVRIVSGNPVLTLLKDGVQLGSEYTDSSTGKRTSGRRGVLATGTAALSNIGDTYSDNFSSVNIVVNDRASHFVEGIRAATPTLPVTGTYVTMAGSLQARVIDGNGNPLSGFDWTTKVASPSGGTFSSSIAGLPVGGPYTLQVRDSADTATIVAMPSPFYVGAVVILWGQSQCQILTSDSGAAPVVNAAANVFQLFIPELGKRFAATSVSSIKVSGSGVNPGSGIAAIANQWHADTGGTVPLLIVDACHEGTSINNWIDPQGVRVSTDKPFEAGWYLYGTTTNPPNGIFEKMMNAADRQATAVMWMHGTSNVSSIPGANPDYPTMMGTLGDKFLVSLPNSDPLFLVQPYHRCCDAPDYTWIMRQMQYQKAQSGGRWRHLIHILDQRMSDVGSTENSGGVHQPGTLDGNVRMGTRIGRGLAATLVNTSLDRWGPRAVSAQFISEARTAFDVTFDKDIELADGSAGTNVPGQFVSEDGGTTWPLTSAGITAEIVGARKLRVTRATGAFPANSRWDLLRGAPYNTRSDNSNRVGDELAIMANELSRVITDTSSFDGGRGMPASPVMGTGLAIAAAAVGAVLPRAPSTLRLSIGLGL